MIDTARIESPPITEELAKEIENNLFMRTGIDLKTGEMVYCITTGELKGTWDSRIMIKIERERWVRSLNLREAQIVTQKEKCDPFIIVECSLHKVMLGHNIYGGSKEFYWSCKYLYNVLNKLLEVELPCIDEWIVHRVDVAEVYQLREKDACLEFLAGFNLAQFPRRKVNRYGDTGIHVPGRTTTIKLYHKGSEFKIHDKKRLRSMLDDEKVSNLQAIADTIIRVEVGIAKRKFEYKYGQLLTVKQIEDEYLYQVYDEEVEKLIREGVESMEIVRNAVDVEKRLRDVYGTRLAGSLLGIWYKLTVLGEEKVKTTMAKPSFYRNRKLIKDAGCSWHGTDIIMKTESLVPVGFSPVRRDKCRLTVVDNKIHEIMAQLKKAS